MTDLTKITTPFGLLDGATQRALREAHASGAKIECFASGCNWTEPARPFAYDVVTYRVKPDLVRDISLAWDALDPKWIAAARDRDGQVFIYEDAPFVIEGGSRCWTSRGPNGPQSFQNISGILKIDPGNKPWDQSLVMRPGYAEETE